MVRKSKAVAVVVVGFVVAALLSTGVAPARSKVACGRRRSRSLVLVSAQTGKVDRSFPDANASPFSMVGDGRGGWFIGGELSCVGGVPVDGVVHLRSNGRLDRGWRSRIPHRPISGGAAELARVGDTLYVNSGSWVAALNARTGARRWLDTKLRGWFGGLAANRNTVFVGGRGSSNIGGVPHSAPLALDAKTGRVLPWRAALPRQFANVASLALSQGRLFMDVWGKREIAVLSVDARTGRLSSWRAPQIKELGGLLVTHGLVFTAIEDGNSLIANASTGKPVSIPGEQLYTGFTTLTAAGNTLYVFSGPMCGRFTIEGQRRDIAAIDLRTLKITPWAPVLRTTGNCVSGIAANSSQILVAS